MREVVHTRVADGYLTAYGDGEEVAAVPLFGLAAYATPDDPAVPDATVHRPDLRISVRKLGGYLGDEVYNTTARKQTKVQAVRRARTRSWWVRVENDGTVKDTYRLRGTRAEVGTRVRYLVGTKDVTARLQSSGGLKVTLAAGQEKLVQVEVSVLGTARVGTRKGLKVTATYSGEVVRKDAVKAVAKVL